ncbi:CPBP family intramembrane glutamic endopeptidase [Marinifilum sp. D737]|uniref:CPBP family intramembrane glutamic endopeptidase n=1 Tax=Marinifilum sp. D737 TaxID=2969628 RepID=UPI002274B54C|nr:type II CAAX endopeptidase family protein [Marinifilum sp. D737]MCY1632867.1 CPBP family intramembrane metalloprotease [Marinifilum sp. D737]
MNTEKQEAVKTEKMAYPSIKQSWGIIGILLLVMIGYSIPVGLIQYVLGDVLQGPMSFVNYVVPLGIMIFIAISFKKKNHKNESAIAFNPFPLVILPMVVIVTLCMLVINIEITSWVPAPEWLMDLFKNMMQDNIWGFVTVAVAAPILEELLMRGIVLDGLLKNYNPWKAIIWSAVFFGIMHFNPWQFVVAFLIGIVMGYLYWKTKSLLLCMIIHAVNNGTAFFLSKSNPDAITWKEMLGLGTLERIGLFFVAILIVWLAYRYFENYFKKNEEPIEELRYNK